MILRLLPVLLLLVSGLSGAAGKNHPAPAAEAALAGKFAGKWAADDGGAGGDLEVVLRRDDQARWIAEARFTFEGTSVPRRTQSVTVEGAKLVLGFDWQIQEARGRSTVTGELAGDALGGAYESHTGEARTRGTWRLTRLPEPAAKKA
jgi:hypothetical protein